MSDQHKGEFVKHRKTGNEEDTAEEDDDEEYGVRKTVKRLDPREPCREEREEHEKTHMPFRNWCRHCVRARQGGGMQGSQGGHDMAEVHLDFMFMGDEGEDRTLAVLVVTRGVEVW